LKSAADVLRLLSMLNKEYGKAVVMVTHNPHAAHYATKVRHLEKGKLLPEGQVPEDWKLRKAAYKNGSPGGRRRWRRRARYGAERDWNTNHWSEPTFRRNAGPPAVG